MLPGPGSPAQIAVCRTRDALPVPPVPPFPPEPGNGHFAPQQSMCEVHLSQAKLPDSPTPRGHWSTPAYHSFPLVTGDETVKMGT